MNANLNVAEKEWINTKYLSRIWINKFPHDSGDLYQVHAFINEGSEESRVDIAQFYSLKEAESYVKAIIYSGN